MKTVSIRTQDVRRAWYVVDAENQTLGRLASAIALRLRGKHKPEYTPHVDAGDYIIVVNADKVRVTGNKETDKIYHRHSGYPGGLKRMTLRELLRRFPTRALKFAIKGMLPKGPLGRRMMKKLKVYAGAEHPHQAQQPQALEW